jgi:hypothetical protein
MHELPLLPQTHATVSLKWASGERPTMLRLCKAVAGKFAGFSAKTVPFENLRRQHFQIRQNDLRVHARFKSKTTYISRD